MTLARAEIDALISGGHDNPFAVLGPHVVPTAEDSGIAIRAFLPEARAVTVKPLGPTPRPRAMERLHDAGLFEAVFPSQPGAFAYRLEVEDDAGRVAEIEDPYRFPSMLGALDLQLFGEGTHYKAYEKLGAHLVTLEGVPGVVFAVWAPNARRVSVVGDWNGWDGRHHPMRLHPGNGIWELFIPGLGEDVRYKFEILARSEEPLATTS